MTTETPTSTQALLHVACGDVPAPPMRLAGAADRTAGWMLKDGTVDLDLYDEPLGLYHLRRSSTAARSEIFEGFKDERLLSVEERRALRDRLLARGRPCPIIRRTRRCRGSWWHSWPTASPSSTGRRRRGKRSDPGSTPHPRRTDGRALVVARRGTDRLGVARPGFTDATSWQVDDGDGHQF